MIRKSILWVTTVVLLSSAAVATVATSASAGGYGYGYSNGGGYGGYQDKKPRTYRSHNTYQGGNPHLRWCHNRYRSYREYDNTFQPYHGPRQHCLSPYEDERLLLLPENPVVSPDVLFSNEAGATDAPELRDEFGNLPECRPLPAPNADTAGSDDLRDAFGNLPETAPAAAPADTPREAAPAVPAPVTPAPALEPQGEGARTEATDRPAAEPQATAETGQPAAPAQVPSQAQASEDAVQPIETNSADAAPADAADAPEDLLPAQAADDDQSS